MTHASASAAAAAAASTTSLSSSRWPVQRAAGCLQRISLRNKLATFSAIRYQIVIYPSTAAAESAKIWLFVVAHTPNNPNRRLDIIRKW